MAKAPGQPCWAGELGLLSLQGLLGSCWWPQTPEGWGREGGDLWQHQSAFSAGTFLHKHCRR